MTPLGIVGDDGDLFAAGMDSLAAVQVMLRIEERFDIELPDEALNRRSFGSISALETALRSVMV